MGVKQEQDVIEAAHAVCKSARRYFTSGAGIDYVSPYEINKLRKALVEYYKDDLGMDIGDQNGNA